MTNEMKTAFDGLRAGVQDTLEAALIPMAESMAKKIHANLTNKFMTAEDTLHLIWLSIADISADKVRAYRKKQKDKP